MEDMSAIFRSLEMLWLLSQPPPSSMPPPLLWIPQQENLFSESMVFSEWMLPDDQIHSFHLTAVAAPLLDLMKSFLEQLEEEVSNLIPAGGSGVTAEAAALDALETPKKPHKGTPSSLSRNSFSL